MELPQLRGTPKQVEWAEKIRACAFAQDFAQPTLVLLAKIEDSSWWIANRGRGPNNKLAYQFKDPAPHQLVGGPPPPAKPTQRPAGEPRAGDEPETTGPPGQTKMNLSSAPYAGEHLRQQLKGTTGNGVEEPHEAELFAASVCRNPTLAEIAVLGLLARLYKGEVGATLRHRAECKLEGLREALIAAVDKDIDGLWRILGKK